MEFSENRKNRKIMIFDFRFFDFWEFSNSNFSSSSQHFLKNPNALERCGDVGSIYDEKTSFPVTGVDWDIPLGGHPTSNRFYRRLFKISNFCVQNV